MVTARMLAGATATPTFSGPYDLFYQFAQEFSVSSVGFIDELSYFTDSLLASHQPTGLRLWNITDGVPLATVSPIPLPTVTGWQRFTLASTPAIDNLKTYAIAGWYDTAHGGYRYSTYPTPTAPFTFAATAITFSISAVNTPSSLTTATTPVALDVQYNEVGQGITTGTTTPATTTDVGSAIGSLGGTFPDWLSLSANTHGTDSAPIDTNARVRAIKTEEDDIQTLLTANLTGFSGTFGATTLSSTNLKGAILALLALASTIITDLGFLRDLFPTGHTPSDHDASLEAHRAATEPDGETLPAFIEAENATLLTAITDQTNEITQILAHGNGTEDVPTIVGESDWSNIFRFDVAADFYTVDITTTDIEAVVEDVGGTQVWDHLGFCIPLTVDGLPEYGPRLAIGGQVVRTGRQMGGIILNGRRVLSGHVTAYQYQPL